MLAEDTGRKCMQGRPGREAGKGEGRICRQDMQAGQAGRTGRQDRQA
jgi:hypothetical protein